MSSKIQSDKSVKIYTKINVFTNIKFNDDISLDLNNLNIKKNQNYIFSTFNFYDHCNNISYKLLKICEDNNFLNVIILSKKINNQTNKILKTLYKLHYVFGKKIILISNRNIFYKNKINEFVFYIKTNNTNKNFIIKKIKEKLLKI